MKLTCNSSKPPLAGVITAEYLKQTQKIEIEWSTETIIENNENKLTCTTNNEVCRALARLLAEKELYGANPEEKTEVDHWLTYSIGPLSNKQEYSSALPYLNKILGPVTYLVGKRLTIADFSVFTALYVSKEWHSTLLKKEGPQHLLRWYNFIASQKAVKDALASLPEEAKDSLMKSKVPSRGPSLEKTNIGQRNQEGKFVDLPGAEMSKVVVRFPPEASGYLHIGHAKAALLNQYYQQAFQGKLIMRFDDTNPAKENVHFEQVILEDLQMLQIKPDLFTHTSNYFDLMIEYCERLLKDGKAYVDDTEPEQMKLQREQRAECANRTNSVEKNFEMWEEMKKGTVNGQKCCVRAKIDMQSPNGCMRDPTIYRCKNEIHPRTGDKYKVYPTYDFACPIVDAIENVTHTLRTMEYHDRDAQFYWFIEALNLRRPYIWEYSRLSMTNTVLSKRKLTWFVQEHLVDGWDDARFPTVRGVLRRGMTVEGLKQFIIAQGSSRSVVFMEWDKIWAFNKKVIDPIAPRYTAVNYYNPVPVLVKGIDKVESLSIPLHPKNPLIGKKEVWIGPKIMIDYEDAESLKEGENTTFINWGNLLIKKINREGDKITSIVAATNLSNKDYKKTLKITWLCETDNAPFTPCWVVYFDHIINKAVLGKDEDFKKYIGHKTRFEYKMLGDPELKKLKVGSIIQLQRRGFFRVDEAYGGYNRRIHMEKPVILFHIPDGHAKENPMPKYKYEVPERTPTLINSLIIQQKEKLEEFKVQKASQEDLEDIGSLLFQYKEEYKQITGSEWVTGCVPPPTPAKQTEKKTTAPTADEISSKIQSQGEIVRDLKTKKAEKATIDKEVKTLLELKADFKKLTGKDWVPITTTKEAPKLAIDENTILEKINLQGDKIRDLKTKKAEKTVIEPEVKLLLSLKADYKTLTGKEWKVGTVPSVLKTSGNINEEELLTKIAAQGEKVRKIKSEKAEKSIIDAEIKALLTLKADYKNATGKEWKPSTITSKPVENITLKFTESEILDKINAQGDKIRKLKTEKAEKGIIEPEIKLLLAYKADYKTLTGKEWKVGAVATENKQAVVNLSTEDDILDKIAAQGDKIRILKAEKADKSIVGAEVTFLLALKAEYKALTGKDWKAGTEKKIVSEKAVISEKITTLVDNSSSEEAILDKIAAQGDKIRILKAEKADKSVVSTEVTYLLALKSDYKALTGKDWKPGTEKKIVSETPVISEKITTLVDNSSSEEAILDKITAQGDKIRILKAEKADKVVVGAEVTCLLALKADYKALTGKDWQPGTEKKIVSETPVISEKITKLVDNSSSEESILDKIAAQGDKIRILKAEKADKVVVGAEVTCLLALKADYKALTGKDWKPGTVAKVSIPVVEVMNEQGDTGIEDTGSGDTGIGDTGSKEQITAKINEQGVIVRTLKSSGAPKSDVEAAVKQLLDLKAEYKAVTGTDFPVAGRGPSKPKEPKAQAPKEPKSAAPKEPKAAPKQAPNKKNGPKDKKPVDVQEDGPKKQTRLGLEAKKEENLSDWYSQVITKGEMIEYYDVSGCYIFRPWSFAIWESIRDWFDAEIKKLGVQNCYFPIFVSKSVLEKEKTHIADFAPEVAWVTRSGDSEMAEPIAVRPTSETVMYPAYAKWIQSYRDLPIKLNQWNNVVRWEFKHPQPFLRTREFLWQEGHTAYALKEEADIEVSTILDLYARIYTDLLAIPVVKGRKTEKEKFAGGDYTLTVEAFVSASGRAIQGATSHHLGQNFSKMFDITFEDPDTQEKKFVFQNSWGVTTRTIGVMIMIHADNQGLVLPPRVASVQIVIVPCGLTVSLAETEKNALQIACDSLESDLKTVGVRVKGDYRSNYSPGWKFNHWELKGVPIRVEYGPKDLKNKQLVAVRRDTGEKITIKIENAVKELTGLLESIQKNLYDNALNDLTTHTKTVMEWSQFCPNLENKNIILAPFCGETECEDKIKNDSAREDAEAEPGAPAMGAKSLCIPLEQPAPLKSTDKCIHPNCQRKAKFYTLFGRSY